MPRGPPCPAFRAVLRVAVDLCRCDHGRPQNVLPVIDVGHEGVQCTHALPQPGSERPPFLGREDPGDDVERDQPLVALLLAVDRESDADTVEQAVGLGALLPQRLVGLSEQPVGVGGIMLPDAAIGRVHLVIGRLGTVHLGIPSRDPSENRASPARSAGTRQRQVVPPPVQTGTSARPRPQTGAESVPPVRLVEVVRQFGGLHGHAALDLVDHSHDCAHHVVDDPRVRLEQALEGARLRPSTRVSLKASSDA